MGREELIRKLQESHRVIEPGQEVTIDSFRPEDALGVALAYYETYGDTFPLEHVYDPREIIRRNATDDQYTVVARTPRGEIVGLIGLFRHAPNPNVYESGQLMVLKSYRNRHLSTEFSKIALDSLPRQLGIPVVFLEAVSNHSVSQRIALPRGLVFTGLEVECMPPGVHAKEDDASHNISLFLMFKLFEKTSCDVYLPEPYRTFCETIYAEQALPRVFSSAAALTGETLASPFFIQETGLMRLTVTRAGRDFAEVVAAAEAKAGPRGVLQLFLNLGDGAAPQAVEVLRDRGYFLAGLQPYWFGADGLLMQKVGREPDWDAIQGVDRNAAVIRDMVREDFERTRCREHRSA
ncbi:MAG: GNAT family N-acetyltransferase [Solidesulfovibrio sp. DCME]|uniref:GNAT family N-acetyltransferase n=1 Tax=Solidesulfovibrio sp. DCME TaxID=3447380 RepID=UPI003D131975